MPYRPRLRERVVSLALYIPEFDFALAARSFFLWNNFRVDRDWIPAERF
jgi:hypothetical protein